MIKRIHVDNFKALKSADIIAGSLNIYTGLNGMGKSTAIQALLLLRQSYLQNELKTGLALNGDYAEIGVGKDALASAAETSDKIGFEIVWENSLVARFKFNYDHQSDVLLVSSDSVVPGNVFKETLFTKDFRYLNAERIGPKSFYKGSSYQVKEKGELGNIGEFAVYFLGLYSSLEITNEKVLHPSAKSNQLLSQVDAWLGEITPGTRLSTDFVTDAELVKLAFQFESGKELTSKFRPSNVGFGLSYVLPIIIAVLTATSGSTLIIENPESHIHPRGQSKIAELILLAASSGVQVFLETHSDHVINAVRVAVKNKLIPREDVKVYFFNRDQENQAHKTELKQIFIEEDGKIDEWPKGFFDEWDNQLDKL
jgi:predicted ATPase